MFQLHDVTNIQQQATYLVYVADIFFFLINKEIRIWIQVCSEVKVRGVVFLFDRELQLLINSSSGRFSIKQCLRKFYYLSTPFFFGHHKKDLRTSDVKWHNDGLWQKYVLYKHIIIFLLFTIHHMNKCYGTSCIILYDASTTP